MSLELALLPLDMKMTILSLLEWVDLLRMSATSVEWHFLCCSDFFWKEWSRRQVLLGSAPFRPQEFNWKGIFKELYLQGPIPMPLNSLNPQRAGRVIKLDPLDHLVITKASRMGRNSEQAIQSVKGWKLPMQCPFLVPEGSASQGYLFTRRQAYYYEVTIEKGSNKMRNDECIAVGLAPNDFPLRDKLPGWLPKSYGYHSDDGFFYKEYSFSMQYGPKFGVGDCVGCGLDTTFSFIFFTLNGEFLGIADLVPNLPSHPVLYPTLGLDTQNRVRLNFGQEPFKFNLELLPTGNNLELVLEKYNTLTANSNIETVKKRKFLEFPLTIGPRNIPRVPFVFYLGQGMGSDQDSDYVDEPDTDDLSDDEDWDVRNGWDMLDLLDNQDVWDNLDGVRDHRDDLRDHRDDVRDNRDIRNNQNGRDVRNNRDVRDARDMQDVRDARDVRDVRDVRDARDARDVRDVRDARDVRDVRDVRDLQDMRDVRDVRDARDVRDVQNVWGNWDAWDDSDDDYSPSVDEESDSDVDHSGDGGDVTVLNGGDVPDLDNSVYGRRLRPWKG